MNGRGTPVAWLRAHTTTTTTSAREAVFGFEKPKRSNGAADGKGHHEKSCDAAQKHAAETRGRQLERAADASCPPASSVASARQDKKKEKRRRESSSAGAGDGRSGAPVRRSYLILEKHQANEEIQIAIDENKRVDDMKTKIYTAIRAVAERNGIPENTLRSFWTNRESIKQGAVNPQPSTLNPQTPWQLGS